MKRKGWIDEPLYKKIQASIAIAAVDLLVVHQGRLLLMKRNNEPAKDEWFTPGGRIFFGETIDEAARRILEKETGLNPLKMEKKGVMSHIWPNHHTVTIFYRVDVDNDDVEMNYEHKAFKWISNYNKDLHPYLKKMIKKSNIYNDRVRP